MERNIEINGNNYLIKGKWEPQGISVIFNGEALDSESKKAVLTIEFSVPFSALRKFGQGAMEDEIIVSVKEHLEQKA